MVPLRETDSFLYNQILRYRDVFDRARRHREVCSGCAIRMCLSVYVISCMVSSCMLSGCVLSCVVSIFVTLGKVRRFVNMLSRNALLRSVTSSLHAIAVRAISQRPRFLFDYLQLYMALFRKTDRSIPDSAHCR